MNPQRPGSVWIVEYQERGKWYASAWGFERPEVGFPGWSLRDARAGMKEAKQSFPKTTYRIRRYTRAPLKRKAGRMSDEASERRAREFCGLMPYERITADSYAGRVMAMLAEVRREALEEAAKVADTEEVPDPNGCPPDLAITNAQAVALTIGVVGATKKSIAERIRALLPATKEGNGDG